MPSNQQDLASRLIKASAKAELDRRSAVQVVADHLRKNPPKTAIEAAMEAHARSSAANHALIYSTVSKASDLLSKARDADRSLSDLIHQLRGKKYDSLETVSHLWAMQTANRNS